MPDILSVPWMIPRQSLCIKKYKDKEASCGDAGSVKDVLRLLDDSSRRHKRAQVFHRQMIVMPSFLSTQFRNTFEERSRATNIPD